MTSLMRGSGICRCVKNEPRASQVADNPDEKIKLKMFHAEIINDADKLNEEVSRYKIFLWYLMLPSSRCSIIITR
jgi:hypothetical protein